MSLKKIFYKLFSKKKYFEYKIEISKKKRLRILKNGLDKEITNIQNIIQTKKEISFLHSGHLGDIINAMPVLQKISENHKCYLYIQANKNLPIKNRFYKNSNDLVYLDDKSVDMLIPLLQDQPFLTKVEKYYDQKIDINFDLFRNLPINFNEDNIRWYSLMTGMHPNLSLPSLFVKENKLFKNKVIIIRTPRRKNIFINYKFLSNYKNLLFVGLHEEYLDLKKEVPNLEFYNCINFLEMAEIIKAGKFFLGNPSLGYTIAEQLKVPRLLENFPEYHVMNPNGSNAYDFYFQSHFEKWFSYLYSLNN